MSNCIRITVANHYRVSTDEFVITLPAVFFFFIFRGHKSFSRGHSSFHDRPVWRISVRLSDRSEVTQHKINVVKNCPQWGLNSQTLDHQSGALLTVLDRNLLEISEVSFLLFHVPLHMLDFVYF